MVFDGCDLAQSQQDLGAIWGRGVISARSEGETVTPGLYRHRVRLKYGSHAPGFVTVRQNGAE